MFDASGSGAIDDNLTPWTSTPESGKTYKVVRNWCKFRNGFCIQWGTSELINDGTDFDISMKLPYRDQLYSVSAIGINNYEYDDDEDPLTHQACDNIDVGIFGIKQFILFTWSFLIPVHIGTEYQHSSPPKRVQWQTTGFVNV